MDDYEVLWSGRGSMPHQERDAQYWIQKESMLQAAAPERGAYPSTKDVKRAKLEPSGWGWRSTPALAQTSEPETVKVNCRNCGKKYRTRIARQMRLCRDCRGGRRTAA